MITTHELFISARDAEALAAMLGAHRRAHPFEPDPADELVDRLMQARLLPDEALPADRVAMNSSVTYVEAQSRVERTVTLAYPAQANPAAGRISVLSPVGRALLGRQSGDTVDAMLPAGRSELRIVDVQQPPELRAAA